MSVAGSFSPAIFSHLNPLIYHRHFAAASIRSDGRAFEDCRAAKVSTGILGSTAASSMVSMGETSVICGLNLEVCRPLENFPDAGRVSLDVQLSPLCNPKMKIGRPLEKTIAMGQSILNILLQSHYFQLSQFSIESNISCFLLYFDIICLSEDGNLFDCLFSSIVHAFSTLKIPKTEIHPETHDVFFSELSFTPVSVPFQPFSLSFSSIEGNLLADPTMAEEKIQEAAISLVGSNRNGEFSLLAVQKAGGEGISEEQLKHSIGLLKKYGPRGKKEKTRG